MVQVDADRITQVRRGVMSSFSPLIAKHHIKVKIPYELVGLVVGPKGATVKKIQQATNTTIVSPSRHQKDPLFYVYGQTSDSVEAAKKEIKSYIAMRTGNSRSSDSLPSAVISSPKAKSDTFGGKSSFMFSPDIFKKGSLNTSPLFKDPADTEISGMDSAHVQLGCDLDVLTDSLGFSSRMTMRQKKVCILGNCSIWWIGLLHISDKTCDGHMGPMHTPLLLIHIRCRSGVCIGPMWPSHVLSEMCNQMEQLPSM